MHREAIVLNRNLPLLNLFQPSLIQNHCFKTKPFHMYKDLILFFVYLKLYLYLNHLLSLHVLMSYIAVADE